MKTRLSRNFTIMLLVLLSFSSLEFFIVNSQVEDTWTSLAPIQEARYKLGVVAENEKIYAMGGYPGSGPDTNINEEYDPKTDTWTTKTPMPETMSDFGITTYHGKIYCFNGETGNTYAYTPLFDSWEQKASLLNPREGITANTLNDNIYILGGNIPIMNVYNPSNDSWTTKSSLIASFSSYSEACASVVFEGKIHAFGAVPFENSHQIYDPENDTWSLGEPLFGDYFSVACATTGMNAPKQIFVFGADAHLWGLVTPNLTSQSYNPKTGNWTNISTIPSGHLIGGAAVLNDQVYVIGGAGAGYGGIHANLLSRLYTPSGYGTPDPTYVSPDPTPTPTGLPPIRFYNPYLILFASTLLLIALGILTYYKKYRGKKL